ncbi:MAG: hypothetical protein HOP30_14870 [Cyclobacteriaceae bacterium]|nr:hypothetical protein [Cyclobacteriaceae bacterium]
MSDYSISIVPRKSSYPNNTAKAKEVLDWLTSRDIVKPTLSDCILSSDHGYAISEGARHVTNLPEELPYNLITNGLEITTQRQVFHTGGNGLDQCICPNCKENIAFEDWSFIDSWAEQKDNNLICSLCMVASDVYQFTFSPEWGFSDLGFTFWNWPDFTDDFLEAFKQQLSCDISIVYTHI